MAVKLRTRAAAKRARMRRATRERRAARAARLLASEPPSSLPEFNVIEELRRMAAEREETK